MECDKTYWDAIRKDRMQQDRIGSDSIRQVRGTLLTPTPSPRTSVKPIRSVAFLIKSLISYCWAVDRFGDMEPGIGKEKKKNFLSSPSVFVVGGIGIVKHKRKRTSLLIRTAAET